LSTTRESTERIAIPASARLADDADWTAEPADLSGVGTPLKRFSWLSPRTLWRSRNNVLAAFSGDPTESARAAWVHVQKQADDSDFTITRDDLGEFSFMLIGDTGEGDRSQYSVVPAFLRAGEGTEFSVIASDVVYPDGDINDYVGKFFVPFAHYPQPIYAIPGNHDWLDGLVGFMRHFCGVAPPQQKFRPRKRAKWSRIALLFHLVFWRRPRSLKPETLQLGDELRSEAQAKGPAQPNMYFCIDTPELRVIAIDVGIMGRLDHEQGEWLKRVSAGPKPKLLVSGKPVYSGPHMSPRRILGADGGNDNSGMIWSVVRDPENNFISMVSGDVHHYERHSVRVSGGRKIECVISGGGGAFMTSTHQIARVERPDVDESNWVVFPTRADSLRAYSIILQRKLRRVTFWRANRPIRGIPADEATAIVARRHGLDPAAELARGASAGAADSITISRRSRLLATIIYPLRGWFAAEKISEALDWDDPPFFKNFMRVEVASGAVTLTSYGVTGLERDVADPAVIDRVVIETGEADGSR
jgi:hypothetical protein